MENELLIIKLAKPYDFEGTTYHEIDLSGLENLTASDLIQAEKAYVSNGNMPILPELTMEYACHISAAATVLPLEFFKGLPVKEASRLKITVRNFIAAED